MADQNIVETHRHSVSQSGGANLLPKPSDNAPRRTKHTGHHCCDAQITAAGEGRAINTPKPMLPAPAPENDADRAKTLAKPNRHPPDPHESPQGGTGPTILRNPDYARPVQRKGAK